MKRILLGLAVGALSATFFAFMPVSNAMAASLVTNGSSEIGTFPVAEAEMIESAWRIDTTTIDSATVVTTTPAFAGPSFATLSNPTGWTRVINDSMDDDYVGIPFGFDVSFNGESYARVFVGSNTYFTFGKGDTTYYDLAADNPPFPGVHICSSDNSYQRVYYRLDDADTMRVRYEGTDSTGGTVGEPTIVYEVVYYRNQPYHDLYIGRNDSCGSYPGVTVDKLGNGLIGDYSLPATTPGSPEHDRGDLYADQLIFSDELTTSSRAAVEGSITALASGDTPRFVWDSSTLNIYSSSTVTWPQDVLVQVTSMAGYTSHKMLLIDADDVPPTVMTVLGDGSYDYELPSTCPSVACSRGDIYGASITFDQVLSAGGRTAVESALTAGASAQPRTYVWRDEVLRIYATTTVVFEEDVFADLTDEHGNTASHQRLVDSMPVPPMEVWVDDDYSEFSSGGHVWQEDAFDDIDDALDAVAEGGRVNVLAGDYEDDDYTIDKNGITLIGPSSGSPARLSASCDDVITVDGADGVTISNFTIKQTDGGDLDDSYCFSTPVIRVGWNSASTTISNNFIAGGYIGIALRYDSVNNTLRDNNINNNYWAGVVALGYGVHTFTGNTIEYNERGLSLGEGPSQSYEQDWEDSEISGNIIRYNTDEGIYYTLGNQGGPVNIGPDNEIYENGDGIVIDGPAYDLHINGNQIYDNQTITSGLHVEGADTGLDAARNWWGDESGPYESLNNPEGIGNAVYIGIDSEYVYYRPFCLNAGCTSYSSVTVDPGDLSSLFDNGGSITPILTSPDDADPETLLVDQLQVNEAVTITVPTPGGDSSVTLPAGTVITKTGGGTFDANDLSSAEVSLGSLSGFPTGQVVEGAIEWGLPDLGLTFSQPITITLYVGADLNGTTLSIVRSNSLTGGWTNDGIVPPATCVVASGLCTFQTTKASYFVANSQSTPVASSGGGGGSYSAPSAVGDGSRTANVAMGAIASIGRVGTGGVNLLHYINSIADFETYGSKDGSYGMHSFKVTALDLLNKKYTFTVQSEPQTFTIGLGETVQVDLDGDSVKDISVKFSNLYVNRIETTLKQLSPAAVEAVETPSVAEPAPESAPVVDFLAANGIIRNAELESKVLAQVQADAKEFGLVLEGISTVVDYVAYGNSPASLKFGQGERRAILRDYLETVNRANIVWEDMERLAVGQIPKVRNLQKERANVSRALPVFRKIFGHDPNFQNATENLAWNTLMYRIRFSRDMGKESSGLAVYRRFYGHSPSTPFGWSVVRVLGYVK
jgi:hypothetical protein